MSFDFNRFKNSNYYGPAPVGSKFLVKFNLQPTEYNDGNCEFFYKSRNNLLFLSTKSRVITKCEYYGLLWFQNIILPPEIQDVELDEKQKRGCYIGARLLTDIVNSHFGLSRFDDSKEAQEKRVIDDWTVLDDIEIPICVGMSPWPYKDKLGNEHQRNRIARVLVKDDADYDTIMSGQAIIPEEQTTTQVIQPKTSSDKNSLPVTEQTFDDPFN